MVIPQTHTHTRTHRDWDFQKSETTTTEENIQMRDLAQRMKAKRSKEVGRFGLVGEHNNNTARKKPGR